ncbi:MAG: hypothetical protein WKF95_10660 [Rubrobacter sp.]
MKKKKIILGAAFAVMSSLMVAGPASAAHLSNDGDGDRNGGGGGGGVATGQAGAGSGTSDGNYSFGGF